jgi:hypothetical protein
LQNPRIYLKQESVGAHSPRTILLQTLGRFEIAHDTPRGFADFLRQRVEANYFAAAVLMPERSAVWFLLEARRPGRCPWGTCGTSTRCPMKGRRTSSPTIRGQGLAAFVLARMSGY